MYDRELDGRYDYYEDRAYRDYYDRPFRSIDSCRPLPRDDFGRGPYNPHMYAGQGNYGFPYPYQQGYPQQVPGQVGNAYPPPPPPPNYPPPSEAQVSVPTQVRLVEQANNSKEKESAVLPPPPPLVRRPEIDSVEEQKEENEVVVLEENLNDNESEGEEDQDWYEEEDIEEDEQEDNSIESKEFKKFKNKVKRVRKFLGLPETESISASAARSELEAVQMSRACLPKSSVVFEDAFDRLIHDLKGLHFPKDKQKKGKKVAPKLKDVGVMPKLFVPNMDHYEVEECPWKEAFLDSDAALYGSSLYKKDANPSFEMSVKNLLDLEDSNRKSLNVLSSLDMFLWVGNCYVDNLKKKLKTAKKAIDVDNPKVILGEEHLEDLLADCKESMSMLNSAAKGVTDLVKMTVGRVSRQVLIRRDNWFKEFTTKPSRNVRLLLRHGDFNGDGLFGSDVLDRALTLTKQDKQDDVQDHLLQGTSQGENKGRGSFRGGHSGTGSGSRRAGGRGGRGTGFGRGSGYKRGMWNLRQQGGRSRGSGQGQGRSRRPGKPPGNANRGSGFGN